MHPQPPDEHILVDGAMATPGNGLAERIQVLDMEEYFSGDAGRVANFCENLREQCHTVGFFYVRNHGVPLELCDSFLQLGREFFDLPSESKVRPFQILRILIILIFRYPIEISTCFG